tara:strand:- start:259 stop:672 length:414 start_codon:yes stop_codon:yes gene_type:complete
MYSTADQEPISRKVVMVTRFDTTLDLIKQIDNLVTFVNYAKKLKAELLVPFFNVDGFKNPTQLKEIIDYDQTDFGNIKLFFHKNDIESSYTFIMLDIVSETEEGLVSNMLPVKRILFNNLKPELKKIMIVWNKSSGI